MADSAKKVAADLMKLAAKGTKSAAAITRRYGFVLEADVKRRAARSRTLPSVPGMPPRLQTGDYNRSINTRITNTPITAEADVGTNKIQARRLELGFLGAGSHTFPHPHFGPAFERVGPMYLAALEKAMTPKGRDDN